MSDRYEVIDNTIVRNGDEGPEQLTNFTARIVKELVYHDGNKTTTHLVIDGTLHDGSDLPEITIPASDFAGLGWVADKWGMIPIIFPVSSGERDLRTAIQLFSKPTKQHIYTHTGWAKVKGEDTYLTATGGINKDGLDTEITVQLPHELSRYALPSPAKNKAAFLSSLRLVNIGPRPAMWTMLLSTYRAATSAADFAVHLAGRTGTFKSEITSLFQSHFGEKMDARHLPASWNSTANAIEHLSYRAKDALFVLDDFVPIGTQYQVRQLQKNADQIIRAQGNQSGRSRLTDVSSMQTTYFPRGVILSTGEDIPEGHSVRGRMMIVELAPGDIGRETIGQLTKKFRDENLELGHTRTPTIVGNLLATLHLLYEYAVEEGFVTIEQMEDVVKKGTEAIKEAAKMQAQYLETADPVNAIFETLSQMFSSGFAHARTKNGGIPKNAQNWGWTEKATAGEMPTYQSHGPRVGWVDYDSDEFLLDPGALVLLKKHSNGKIAVTNQTLMKRIKEAGQLTRTDDSRQRNTVRCTCEGHPHQVLALPIASFTDGN
jgi:hypothetical protein